MGQQKLTSKSQEYMFEHTVTQLVCNDESSVHTSVFGVHRHRAMPCFHLHERSHRHDDSTDYCGRHGAPSGDARVAFAPAPGQTAGCFRRAAICKKLSRSGFGLLRVFVLVGTTIDHIPEAMCDVDSATSVAASCV